MNKLKLTLLIVILIVMSIQVGFAQDQIILRAGTDHIFYIKG